jgi:hypothetical protein
VIKDLHGHPVLGMNVGHVGGVVSPHMVDFMKSGKFRKKNRVSLLLLCNHRPVGCDQHELPRQTETGGPRVLVITVFCLLLRDK